MLCAQPTSNLVAKPSCQGLHPRGFVVGYHPGTFVAADIPLLAKEVQLADQVRICRDRLGQRLDDSVVMGIPRGPVAHCGQSRGGRLHGGVVGDIEPPVWAEARGLTIGQVAIDHAQKIDDLLATRFVLDQPTVL